MTIISTTVGKNPLEEMEQAALIVNKRVWNAVLGWNLNSDIMISVHFQDKPFNIRVIQVYAQPVMLKKLKLNGSMKAYKTF